MAEGVQIAERVVLRPVNYGGGWRVEFIASPHRLGQIERVERGLRRAWYRYERRAADGNSRAGGYYHSRDSAQAAIYGFLLLHANEK